MASSLAVIPARFASQRLPGKPLALIENRPMILWVYDAAAESGVFDRVLVATDDERIAKTVRDAGGEAVMTRPDHASGTDRIAEVAEKLPQYDLVANIQGDQPFVQPEMLRRLIEPLQENESIQMTTLGCPLDEADRDNPAVVKVVCDQRGNALYFSRAPIPYFRERRSVPVHHHLGLYAFRRQFLALYASLPPTPFEQCEGLEQLRVLEHGHAIRVAITDRPVLEVNTPEELAQANEIAKGQHSRATALE